MRAFSAARLLAPLVLLASCGETRESAQKGRLVSTVTKTGVAQVLIMGGCFDMGSDTTDEVDEPRHRVFVSPFWIDTHEVTQEHYQKLVGRNPSLWKDPKNPVEQIRWSQAVEYCNARSRAEGLPPAYHPKTGRCDFSAPGYRLPTEAEWEYACRAGTATTWFFGSSPARLGDYAWFRDNCMRTPQAVGLKRPNPWGLYDLYGNVWEWCHDFYAEDYYKRSPDRDPHGPDKGNTRVIRGGSWSAKASQCRSSYRDQEYPEFTDVCFAADRNGLIGFRCVRTWTQAAAPTKRENPPAGGAR